MQRKVPERLPNCDFLYMCIAVRTFSTAQETIFAGFMSMFTKNMLMELADTLGLGSEESHSTVMMYGSSIFLNVEDIHCKKNNQGTL